MAFTYPNGRVPQDKLITFASGWLPNEGTWYHQLPPATYAKHLTLVALAKRRTGRDLRPSEGWSCYRPLNIQEYAKRVHGIFAATPGTSSHGMFWEGIQCAAIDYGNWGYVYDWDRSEFFADVRAAGLEPGLISPQRGYPDEPWHVVDKKPWAAGAATAGGAVPFAPTIESEEDEEMRAPAMFCTTANDKIVSATNPPDTYIITDTNGFFSPVSGIDGAYASRLAQAYEIRVDAKWITKDHARRIERDCADMRAGKG